MNGVRRKRVGVDKGEGCWDLGDGSRVGVVLALAGEK
jgi:hypothetical protein